MSLRDMFASFERGEDSTRVVHMMTEAAMARDARDQFLHGIAKAKQKSEMAAAIESDQALAAIALESEMDASAIMDDDDDMCPKCGKAYDECDCDYDVMGDDEDVEYVDGDDADDFEEECGNGCCGSKECGIGGCTEADLEKIGEEEPEEAAKDFEKIEKEENDPFAEAAEESLIFSCPTINRVYNEAEKLF